MVTAQATEKVGVGIGDDMEKITQHITQEIYEGFMKRNKCKSTHLFVLRILLSTKKESLFLL